MAKENCDSSMALVESVAFEARNWTCCKAAAPAIPGHISKGFSEDLNSDNRNNDNGDDGANSESNDFCVDDNGSLRYSSSSSERSDWSIIDISVLDSSLMLETAP